jgi:RimJ/RimL family protein N-acetyltransferase
MVSLQTQRLLLRPFREDDLDEYAYICADAEVMRYIGDGRPLGRADAWRQMAFLLGHWQLRGFGIWAAQSRETGALLGRIGLYRPEGWPGLEVGWLLDRACWGQGLATEGGWVALEYAFTQLGASHVLRVIHPDNAASIRMEAGSTPMLPPRRPHRTASVEFSARSRRGQCHHRRHLASGCRRGQMPRHARHLDGHRR